MSDRDPHWRIECERLRAAIEAHRSQKADDRCVEDDDRLYEALQDGIRCDRRVGSKEEMLANCKRFIERRCEGGGWPSYADLESQAKLNFDKWWRYEQDCILPCFKWASEAGLDLVKMVEASPGSNCVELLVRRLLSMVAPESFDGVLASACRWFDETIPHEAKDDVTKFREESREFLEEPSVEEAADALLCLVHWAALSGLDLKAAVVFKMAKNRERKWFRQPDGTWSHRRFPEAGDTAKVLFVKDQAATRCQEFVGRVVTVERALSDGSIVSTDKCLFRRGEFEIQP